MSSKYKLKPGARGAMAIMPNGSTQSSATKELRKAEYNGNIRSSSMIRGKDKRKIVRGEDGSVKLTGKKVQRRPPKPSEVDQKTGLDMRPGAYKGTKENPRVDKYGSLSNEYGTAATLKKKAELFPGTKGQAAWAMSKMAPESNKEKKKKKTRKKAGDVAGKTATTRPDIHKKISEKKLKLILTKQGKKKTAKELIDHTRKIASGGRTDPKFAGKSKKKAGEGKPGWLEKAYKATRRGAALDTVVDYFTDDDEKK